MIHERTSVGLDVHALSVAACAIDGKTGELHRWGLTADPGEVHRWVTSVPGLVWVVYEPAEDHDGCVCGASNYPWVTRRYLPQINRGIGKRIEELEHMTEAERDWVLYGRRPSLHDSFEKEEIG